MGWFARGDISRTRVSYVLLAVATIAVGLLVHGRAGSWLGVIRDPVGDALWATMMTWWVSALMPRGRLLTRLSVALAVCVGVELSQLAHSPVLDALRHTTLGQLVLGSGFDARDLAAYALGVSIAALLEGVLMARPRDAAPPA